MSFSLIYCIWFSLIFIEIFRNWCIINLKNRRPRYWWSSIIRITIAFIFWVIVGAISNGHTITHSQWYGMLAMMLLTCWFTFDYGLNQFRNMMYKIMLNGYTPIVYWYLNPKGSWLDQFQAKHPHAYPWFWVKLLLTAMGISIFHYGIDAIWIVK